jgi:hypothetical protein
MAGCANDDLDDRKRDLRRFVDDGVAGVFAVDASPYVGTYDVTFSYDPPPGFGSGTHPVAEVTVWPDGRLLLIVYFTMNDGLSVLGWLSDDEIYFGESSAASFQGDIVFDAVGQLAVSRTGDIRIVGSAEIRDFFGGVARTVTFTLTRPTSGTPSSLGGAYIVGFEDGPSGCFCSSASTLDLTVPADGFGTSAPATDALPDDTVLGTLRAGTCLVSPGGVVRCNTSYDPIAETGAVADCAQRAGGACPAFLQGGLLPVSNPDARGVVSVGDGISPVAWGFFTVTR